MARLFIYGTLKKGQPNYHELLDVANGKAEFLGSARTVQKYPLVIATKNNVPVLLNAPGQGHRVQGELYRVDRQMLDFLDDFEMVPTSYQRTPIELELGEREAGGATEAFVYSNASFPPEWLSLPYYGSYDSGGDHGLKYVFRELRE